MQAFDYIRAGVGTVTLCGSTKFHQQYQQANRILTAENWIVLQPGSFGHSIHKDAKPLTTEQHETVKFLHFQKILESHLVVHVHDGSLYQGDSTKLEMAFARFRGKAICDFNGEVFTGTIDTEPPQELRDRSLLESFLQANPKYRHLMITTGMIDNR